MEGKKNMLFLKRKTYALFALALFALAACDKHPVSSVTLDRNSLTLQVGEQYQLEAVVTPFSAAMHNHVSWESSDESVASVSSDGTVTAIYTGSCVITAKAGKKSASCAVEVGKLDYEFAFERAVALYYGDAYEVGTNNFALRLLGNGVTIDRDGALGGEGVFFNIDLNAPVGNRTVPPHVYELSDRRGEYTFAAGELEERDGVQYATGTFVGQRTAEGLAVVFVKSGSFWVNAADGVYTLEGRFEGEHRETVVISFTGAIDVIDKSGETPQASYTFASSALAQKFLGDVRGDGLNQFQFTAADADTTLIFTLYAPLSVTDRCPVGEYGFSGERSHSIASAVFDVAGRAFAVSSGEVTVAESGGAQTVLCRFVDETGRVVQGVFTDIRSD